MVKCGDVSPNRSRSRLDGKGQLHMYTMGSLRRQAYEVVPLRIHLQGPLKLTGVNQLECCCDPIRIMNTLRVYQTTPSELLQLRKNASSPTNIYTKLYGVLP